MANSWLRLWHDMPTDPKFKLIARKSKQPLALVISTYLHLLVSASRNVTRGHADVTFDEIAADLNEDEDAVFSVIEAMQGRVLDGSRLSGWDGRQPKREDGGGAGSQAKSAAQRKREQREREAEAKKKPDVTDGHAESHKVTLDKDKDKEKEDKKNKQKKPAPEKPAETYETKFERIWPLFDNRVDKKKALTQFKQCKPDDALVLVMIAALTRERRWRTDAGLMGPDNKFGYSPNGTAPQQKQPALWIRDERWKDEIPETRNGKPRRKGDGQFNGFAEADYSDGVEQPDFAADFGGRDENHRAVAG